MTQKKDLKRRVRERMEKTGERYAAALRQVKARKVEPELEADSYLLRDAGESAELRYRVMASRNVYRRARGDRGARLVARFAEVLRSLEGDPTSVLFRRAVSGQRTDPDADARVAVLRWRERLAERSRYARRLELGLRGVSSDGCILSFDHDGELVVASISFFPHPATISLETREDFMEARELVELERLLPFRVAR